MEQKRITELSILANKARKLAFTGIYNAKAGHPG